MIRTIYYLLCKTAETRPQNCSGAHEKPDFPSFGLRASAPGTAEERGAPPALRFAELLLLPKAAAWGRSRTAPADKPKTTGTGGAREKQRAKKEECISLPEVTPYTTRKVNHCFVKNTFCFQGQRPFLEIMQAVGEIKTKAQPKTYLHKF